MKITKQNKFTDKQANYAIVLMRQIKARAEYNLDLDTQKEVKTLMDLFMKLEKFALEAQWNNQLLETLVSQQKQEGKKDPA